MEVSPSKGSQLCQCALNQCSLGCRWEPQSDEVMSTAPTPKTPKDSEEAHDANLGGHGFDCPDGYTSRRGRGIAGAL